ncbi:hypothetical protein ERX27_02420 [Macrococcus brunensis]|uniref:Lipoprotein n=1 Tax=Macrococcus brunensis TaxID=198483 RepID=A0A4R6BFK0_9STAP|nr:hypothetical protein [Macrococcus brunensis]TDL98651.1 hypothetical protein ERX27_02420 [Macrococcus brunensis]
MRKLSLVIMGTSMIMAACGNDSESKKEETASEKSSEESVTLKTEKPPTEAQTTENPVTEEVKKVNKTIDIMSEDLINEFTKDKGSGYQGIEPGLTYSQIKEMLGAYDGTAEMLGGLHVKFGDYAVVFDGVTEENQLSDHSKIKYVFISPDEDPRRE